MKTKGRAGKLIRHFKQRFLQRHEKVITDEDILKIINKVQSGDSVFIERSSRRVSIVDVVLNGEQYRIVYDDIRKIPITTLYPGGEKSWLDE